MARIPGVEQLNKVDGKLRDIANKLDRVTGLYDDMGKALDRYKSRNSDIITQMDRITSAMADQARRGQRSTQSQVDALRDLNKELESVGRRWSALGQVIGGNVLRAFDKLGKSVFTLGLDAMRLGVDKLENAIVQIYQVHEKWARLMGEFRNRLGVATKGVRELGRVAASVEGTIYGLTGAFGQGAPQVAEFVEGLERVVNVVKGDSIGRLVKDGVMLGRAMGVSAGDVGRLAFMLQQLGDGSEAQRDLFKDIQAGAEAAGVSTASFGKELVQSRSFMTSFGREGRKMFIQVAAYARSLGVSLKSLEAFTKVTDTFDSTAQAVAKLNTVFGTTISSLDLMLEQDPSKRLETVRDALVAQGRSFKDLSRQERTFLGDTLNLSQEELAGVISTGKSLDQVQRDQEKARARSERDQKNIQRLVSKTSTTLRAFAQDWDRVWMAVQRLIKPFTDAIGLTKSGDKQARSFSATMKALFDRFVKFIDEVASNPEWQGFMRKLAGDAQDFLKWVSKTVTGSNLRGWVHTVVEGATNFYEMMKKGFQAMVDLGRRAMPIVKFLLEHVSTIVKLWAGSRVLAGVGGAAIKGIGAVKKADGLGGMGGALGRITGMLGKAGLVAGAGAAGYGLGSLLYKGFGNGGIEDLLFHDTGHGDTKIASRGPTYTDRAAARLTSAKAREAVLTEHKNMLDERITAMRRNEIDQIRQKGVLEGRSASETEKAVQKVERYHRHLDALATETRKYVDIKSIENQLDKVSLEMRMRESGARLALANANLTASGGGRERAAIRAMLSSGNFEGAFSMAQTGASHAHGRLDQLQRERAKLVAGHAWGIMAPKELARLKEVDRAIEAQKRSTKNADDFAKVMKDARDANKDMLDVTTKQIKLENKKLELETLLSEIRSGGHDDVAHAIAEFGGAGNAMSKGKFAPGSPQYEMLRRIAQVNQDIAAISAPVAAEASASPVGSRRGMTGPVVGPPINLAPSRGRHRSSAPPPPPGDVYLDGRLVGRHVARTLLQGEGS